MTLLTKKITKAGIVGALLFGLGSFSDARAQDAIKNYWNSNNGMTGGYIEGKVFYGSMSDISNSYDTSTWIPASAVTTSAAGADQDWSFDELVGAKFKIGRDWGKLRVDLSLAAAYAELESIGGTTVYTKNGDCAASGLGTSGGSCNPGRDWGKLRVDLSLAAAYAELESIGGTTVYTKNGDCAASGLGTSGGSCNPDNEGYLGWMTVNGYWDIYRFDLHRFSDNSTWAWNAAVTPYVGGGFGGGGGYMVGYKSKEVPQLRISNSRAGGGYAYNIETGLQINLTSWLSVTAAYNYVDIDMDGATETQSETELHLAEAGVRLTF